MLLTLRETEVQRKIKYMRLLEGRENIFLEDVDLHLES